MGNYQYFYTVNGAESEIMDKLPSERWQRVAECVEARGGRATIYRRFISTVAFLKLTPTPDDYYVIPELDMVVSQWEVYAQLEG